jgi:hypothetical protein
MATLIRQLALVSETSHVDFSALTTTSAALQKQVTRDFAQIWDVQATVDSFAQLKDVPLGYWPIMVRDDINQAGALGVHLDQNNQPFALVQYDNDWQLTASHETLEMLADPFGNRLTAGDSPDPSQGRVEFLVEVCDPSEAAGNGYRVNGILLADFYTPNYFDPVVAQGVRYSYTGAITEPRQVLKGGYLSWHEPVSDEWFQLVYFGDQPTIRSLGKLSQRTGSLRSQIDKLTNAEAIKARAAQAPETGAVSAGLRAAGATVPQQLVARSSEARADSLHRQIEELRAAAAGAAPAPGPARLRRPPRRGQRS